MLQTPYTTSEQLAHTMYKQLTQQNLTLQALYTTSTSYYKHLILQSPHITSTSYCKHLILQAPHTTITSYCKHLILQAPHTTSTSYYKHLTLQAPHTASTSHYKHLILQAPHTTSTSTARNSQSMTSIMDCCSITLLIPIAEKSLEDNSISFKPSISLDFNRAAYVSQWSRCCAWRRKYTSHLQICSQGIHSIQTHMGNWTYTTVPPEKNYVRAIP